MKIKNDLISIKIGKAQYDFKNLILNEYLKNFVTSQINASNNNNPNNRKDLIYAYLKFDEPIENLNETTVLRTEDFDVRSTECLANQEISDTKIITQYNYKFDDMLSLSEAGKKITAIGFFTKRELQETVVLTAKAVLDTSNFNIYLQTNQELTITRKDTVSTDALFYSSDKNKVPGPLHLMPIPNKAIIAPNKITDSSGTSITGPDETYGIIYSIGLSLSANKIDKELIIGQDVQVMQNGTELQIEGIENYFSGENLLYSNASLYPNAGIYPTKINYKYIIIKYKVWQNVLSGTDENPVYTMMDTGYFYYQAIPLDKTGNLNLKIKYERG